MKINITLNNQVMETILNNSKNDVLNIAYELGIDEVCRTNYEKVHNKLREVREEKDASPAGEVVYKNDGENTSLDINIEDRYLVKLIELSFTITKRVLPLVSIFKAAWEFAKNAAVLIKQDAKAFLDEFTVPESIRKYHVFGHTIGNRTVAFTFMDDGYTKRFYAINYHGGHVPNEVLDYVLEELGGQKFAESLNYNLTKREADRKVRRILKEDDQ